MADWVEKLKFDLLDQTGPWKKRGLKEAACEGNVAGSKWSQPTKIKILTASIVPPTCFA